MKIKNILWMAELERPRGRSILDDLPRELEVPEGEDVPEWIEKTYGFTVAGFDMETPEGKRSVVRIIHAI